MNATERALDLRLIVITDTELARPRPVRDIVAAALQAGAPAVQLRLKGGTAREMYEEALELRHLTRRTSARFFVNDRLDVALATGADGVHLGPDDLPIAAARHAARAAGSPHLLIGASTDDPDTARDLVRSGADYIGCGAVFGTTSKHDVGDERIGTDRLAKVVAAVDVPVVGIGGVTPHNAPSVAATGAAGCAVIGAVMGAERVNQTVRALLAPFPHAE
ncbi:MAG: thiamine phosphate synthase [Gemmatimonadota bacterium]